MIHVPRGSLELDTLDAQIEERAVWITMRLIALTLGHDPALRAG